MFGRRYQRKHVGAVERIIGVAVMALLAGIVLCLLLTVGRDATQLFAVPEQHLTKHVPDRGELLSCQLLPSDERRGKWRVDESSISVDRRDRGRTIVHASYRCLEDAAGRARVRITEFADAESAKRAFETGRPSDAESGEAALLSVTGRAGLGVDYYVTHSGAAFWSGRHYTDLAGAGADSRAVISLAAALADRQLAYGPAPGEAEAVAATSEKGGKAQMPEGPLPSVDQAPWRGPEEVKVFGPANLYEKINGRAGIYFSFGFVKLTFGTYRHTRQRDLYVDCYVYDMGNIENAFGMFKAEESMEGESFDIGREAYGAEESVFIWKGAHYIQVLAPGYDPAYSEFIPVLAEAVTDAIDDDGSKLWADAVLPAEDRVEGSFAFLKTDAFNMDFLEGVYVADYQADQGSWSLFVHRASAPGEARLLLQRYAEHLGKYGRLITRQDDFVLGEMAGLYECVLVRGGYLAGANGCEDQPLCQLQAAALGRLLEE